MSHRILAVLFLLLVALAGRADDQKYKQFIAEVEPIMQPEERDAFLKLESGAERDLYIDDFWRRRAVARGIPVEEVRQQHEDRLRIANEKYHSITSDRGRIEVIHGEPLEIQEYGGPDGCHLIQKLQVWTYGYLPGIGKDVRLVFYTPRNGADFRLWLPGASKSEGSLQEIVSSEALATVHGDEAAAVRYVFSLSYEPACRRALRTRIECECARGSEILKLLESSLITQWQWVNAFKPPPINAGNVESLVVANPTAARLSAESSIAFPAGRGARTDVQMTIAVRRSALVMKDVAGGKTYSLDVAGEVLKEDRLYEQYRYRFDYPAANAGDPIVAVFDRFLRPGKYTSRMKITDNNSNSEAVIEKAFVVPEVAPAARATPAVDDSELHTGLRIVPLPDGLLSGFQHIETITAGSEIKAVEFYLDGTKMTTRRSPPFAADLDLGDIPAMHRVRAVALDAHDEFVAGDDLTVNSGAGDFRVRILAPRTVRKLSGPTPVQLAVTTPVGKTLDKVELYLNNVRVATLFGPPYEQTVQVPEDGHVSDLRAVATLTDPDEPQAEDAVVLNTPGFMTEVNVHLIELPTTVTRRNRPVTGLPESAFTVLDDGKPVKLAKFGHVTNLPLSIGIAIDTSTSMSPRIAEARDAGIEFLSRVMRTGDKAFLVSFDLQPQTVQRWTSKIADLQSALEKLRPEESTALYDAIIYSLYNFTGSKGQRALVVITDGVDTSSKYSFDEALEYAKRAAVPIYGIGIGIPTEAVDARRKFRSFCSETGGNVYYIEKVTSLPRIYDEIQNELRSQYILSFYPPADVKPGSPWRSVTVQVSGARTKTIRGYYP